MAWPRVTPQHVDVAAVIEAAPFRDCLEAIAADDGVDAVISVIVSTAIADLADVIAAATLPKPLVAAVLDQAEEPGRVARRSR